MSKRKRAREEPRAPRPTKWPLGAFLAGVFILKLVVMLQLKDHPLLQPEGGLDSVTYAHLAERVLGGDVALGPNLYFVSPLYIYFLATVLGIGDSFTFVRVVQIALGTCAVLFVFLTARAWFGTRAAWLAGALAALTGVLTFYEIVILQSALDTFLTSAVLYALTRALVESRVFPTTGVFPTVVRPSAIAGVLFGLQILNRPNIAIAVAGIIAALLVARRGRVAALVAAGVALAVAPIVLRNAVVSHQLALVSSQGGLNFYIGNNASATGQYDAIPGVRANIEGQSEDTRRVAEKAAGHALSDAEVSSYFRRRATSWMREHPYAAAKLFVHKLALVFNYRHQWLDFSYPYYAYDTGSILWILAGGPWLLVPFGLAGAVIGARRAVSRSGFWVWWSFVPLYAISVAVFFVAERYRLPLFVPLCVTAGAALDVFLGPTSRLQTPTSRLRATALLTAGAVLAFWPFQLNDGRHDERLRLAKALMNNRDFARAASELEAAHRMDPSNAVAEFNLGLALMNDGRASEGVPHIRHAVDAGVPVEGARYALASALMVVDREEAARLLRTFSPLPDDSAESCYRVALLALSAGVPDVAERFIERALALRPEWPDARELQRRIRGS